MNATVWLIRHAPTAWTGRRWCGLADPPLSRDGRAVARTLARALVDELPADALVRTSPAHRARSTAAEIARAARLPVTVDASLREVDVGRAQGLTWEQLEAREPAVAAAIRGGRPVDWPGGEPSTATAERAARVASALEATSGRPLVVVSHGAFLHALIATLLGTGRFERIAGQATEPLRAAEVVRLTRAWPQ